jgi:hypothetical protein
MYAEWALEIALSASLQVVADAEDAMNTEVDRFVTRNAAISFFLIP